MNDLNIMEKVIDRKSVFDGIIIHVEHWQSELPNGKIAPREIAVHVGASAVVPVDEDGNVYMVRQYRCPLETVLLEIPAGKLDHKGEDRLLAAKRELEEETGFTAGKWTHLVDLATTPGFCSEVISLYLAQDLTAGEVHPDEDEFLEVEKIALDKAVDMVINGEIPDGKTQTLIMRVAEMKRRGIIE